MLLECEDCGAKLPSFEAVQAHECPVALAKLHFWQRPLLKAERMVPASPIASDAPEPCPAETAADAPEPAEVEDVPEAWYRG